MDYHFKLRAKVETNGQTYLLATLVQILASEIFVATG